MPRAGRWRAGRAADAAFGGEFVSPARYVPANPARARIQLVTPRGCSGAVTRPALAGPFGDTGTPGLVARNPLLGLARASLLRRLSCSPSWVTACHRSSRAQAGRRCATRSAVIAVDTNILVHAHRADSFCHGRARPTPESLAAGARAWAIPGRVRMSSSPSSHPPASSSPPRPQARLSHNFERMARHRCRGAVRCSLAATRGRARPTNVVRCPAGAAPLRPA